MCYSSSTLKNGGTMFKRLSDDEWNLLKHELPKEPTKRGKGMPHADFRSVLNTILWILLTGARWSDVPQDTYFASKSSSHRWLKKWKVDGTLNRILIHLLKKAQSKDLIKSHRLLVDGSFSPCEDGRR